jgi:hypothetical protein
MRYINLKKFWTSQKTFSSQRIKNMITSSFLFFAEVFMFILRNRSEISVGEWKILKIQYKYDFSVLKEIFDFEWQPHLVSGDHFSIIRG